MAAKLTALLARAPFRLFAVHPRDWEGPSFVGDVLWDADVMRAAAFVYLDQIDGSTMGASVSNIDARVPTSDPLTAHAVPFVSRFEPDFLVRRMKRRRFMPFQREEVVQRPVSAGIAGETAGAVLFTHRALPLQMLRVAKRAGDSITDIGIVTWSLSALEFAGKVALVDARFAQEFDRAREAPYPPPEWGSAPSAEG